MTYRIESSPSKSSAVDSLCRFTNPGSNVIDTAIGLAFARDLEKSFDVKPELLMWFFACDDSQHRIVVEYTALRIICYAAMTGVSQNTEAFAHATLDAMKRVRRGNRVRDPLVPAEKRAREVCISKATYLDLRCAGETYLLQGIRDGLKRYLAACGISELSTPAKVQTEIVTLQSRAANELPGRTEPNRRAVGRTQLPRAA